MYLLDRSLIDNSTLLLNKRNLYKYDIIIIIIIIRFYERVPNYFSKVSAVTAHAKSPDLRPKITIYFVASRA